jgi:glycosyltransferase involved in cell wall biosynthesis
VHVGLSTSVVQRGQSGIAQYVFALTRALIEHGEHDYTLFVLERDLELFQFARGKVRLIAVPEHFRPPVKDILWHQTILPGLTKQLRLDVLHVPSYRRMLWPRPCPLVATIHDLAPFHVRRKYSWSRMLYGRVVAPRLARRQDQIVAISEATAQDVAKFFRPAAERLNVIYNGLEHSRFFSGNSQEAKELNAKRFGLDRSFFLYVARLEHPAKNHNRLIAAFNQFKRETNSDWQLALAGGDWHGADEIHKAINGSPFAKEIRCLGFVPDDHLPDLYRAADVFVYPSLFEGFGMPPIEAMASGCPVISSTCGSLGEVIGNAAVHIDPEDVNSIAAQLRVLSADEAVRRRLRTAGFTQAARFNWANTAAETVKVYERAVGNGGSYLPTSSSNRAPATKGAAQAISTLALVGKLPDTG